LVHRRRSKRQWQSSWPLSLRALHKLVPFGVLGFGLSAASGFMFVVSAPDQYIYNPAFQLKLAVPAT